MPFVSFDIRTNSGSISKQFDEKIRKQIPFVASVGLNSTMTKVRDNELRQSYQSAFQVRNKTFFKAIARVFRSKKGQARNHGAVIASIQEKDLPPPPGATPARGKRAWTEKIRLHTTGGTKTPRGARIAIPVTGGVRRKVGGGVMEYDKPRIITGSKRGFRAGKYIFRRRSKDKLEMVYHLRASAQIDRRWVPEPIVMRGVNNRMRHEFAAAWIKAIKSARF